MPSPPIPNFSHAHAVKIAADSVETLRRCDVYRVLSTVWNRENRQATADYIWTNRVDLRCECIAVMEELAEEARAAQANATAATAKQGDR